MNLLENKQKIINEALNFGFGGMTKLELEYLFDFCENKKILELGSEVGQSSYVMASIAESIICVDIWDDSYDHLNHDQKQKNVYLTLKGNKNIILKEKTTFEKFKENCEYFINSGKIKYVKGLTNIVYNQFENNFFDLILIDADHSFQGVYEDINNYLPKLKKDGLMLFHDFNDINWTGVAEAALKCEKENKIKYVTHSERIAVFKKNNY